MLLWSKKPKQLPAIQAQKILRSDEVSKIIIPSPKKVNAPVPPAKPSIPSVRLIALLSETNTKTDKNQNNIPFIIKYF